MLSSFPGTAAVPAVTAFALFQTFVIAFVALGWGRLTPSGTNIPTVTAA